MNHLVISQLSSKEESRSLTPEQKKFNQLSKGLKRNRELLVQWRDTYTSLMACYAESIAPLTQKVDTLLVKGLLQLDKWYNNKLLTKKQNRTLYDFIQGLSETCVNIDDSTEIQDLFNRYHEVSFEESKKEHFTDLQSEIEDSLGLDLGEDFDFESETAFADFLNKLKDKSEQEVESAKSKSKNKAASPRQKVLAEKELIETQSVKEIFRQLTKSLHPDREMDETLKLKKSELMQRANIAYKNQDLFALLELQFEIQQIEQKDLNNLGTDRLKVYNRLILRQQTKIKQEIEVMKHKISFDLNIPGYYTKPSQASQLLNEQRIVLEGQLKKLERDLESFTEIKSLKRWLSSLNPWDFPNAVRLDDLMAEFF